MPDETTIPIDLPRRTWKQWWRGCPRWLRVAFWTTLQPTSATPSSASLPQRRSGWRLSLWGRVWLVLCSGLLTSVIYTWWTHHGTWMLLMSGGAFHSEVHLQQVNEWNEQAPSHLLVSWDVAKLISKWCATDSQITDVWFAGPRFPRWSLHSLRGCTQLKFMSLDATQVGPELSSLSRIKSLKDVAIDKDRKSVV